MLPTETVNGSAAPTGSGPVVVQAEHITKTYRSRQGRRTSELLALDDVSLSLEARSITALVGESGSGKSTLSRIMARLEEPTSGRLLLNGKEVSHSSRAAKAAYRGEVQLVLQDPFASLNPLHSVRYHLTRPLLLHGMAHKGPELETQLCSLLERVNLLPADQYLDKLPHELSGGQRQRVSIARALAVRPRVLLADEPVSMLDVSIRLGVLNLLEDLRRDEGLTILYITHDIASARYLADRIVVLCAGRVVESGPSLEVTANPQHSYTQLLLSAAPNPRRTAATGSVLTVPQSSEWASESYPPDDDIESSN